MYYSKEYFSFLAPKIRMKKEAFDAVITHFDSLPPSEAENIAKHFADPSLTYVDKSPTIEKIAQKEHGDLLCVLLYMAASGYTRETYHKFGIPDSILYDSFNCLPEKMETLKRFKGYWGYPSVIWPVRIAGLEIFRIGRLSYAMERAPQDIFADGKVLIPKGGTYVHIHIADNDKLIGCAESINAARTFFADFYPQYKDTVFYTRTWLLDPRLSEILSENSNILQFQKAFRIFGKIDGEEQILSRVFGTVEENFDEYSAENSLQRGILSYLKSGKRLGSGMGYTLN